MVLAPQLRQSLEMLQLPIMELRTMIQQEIERNPTIEEILSEKETVEIEPGDGKIEDKEELDFDKELEALSNLDEEWRDYFFQDIQNRPFSSQDAEKRQFLLDSMPQNESLQEHLLNQLHLSALTDSETRMGELLIGSINGDGYLTSTVQELSATTGYAERDIEEVLNIIKDFHPTGVGSADLKECLLTQLDKLGKLDSMAGIIVRDHLDRLGKRKFTEIANALKVDVEAVHEAAKLIATLNPKPGNIYNEEVATYVLPEVVVQKINGEYVVILNDDQLPHVRISKHYKRLLKDAETNDDVKNYIKEKIRSGVFLIKSIQQRQKTVFRIASEIVASQIDFLDNGLSHLKPMTMAEIAATVGVHETTVSRAVSGKYMQTPIGLFDMKYFFSHGIKTANGQELSNKTVKDLIANMVAEEDPAKPLSDQAIQKSLELQGIKIARRTIAKYRLVLKIPPSHQRKDY